jgi:outer membrane receptor protein involved in Fe transport
MMKKLLMLAVLAWTIPLSIAAQGVAGKITGRVIDQATKEALIGASVRVVGTKQGAVTDVNGNYTILNVPIGTYRMRASFVGYTDASTENVRVSGSLTTRSDFSLGTQDKLGNVVDVVATRPLVEPSATTKTMIITQEQIQNAPVRGAQAFVGLQAGVIQDQRNPNTIYIRGGRSGETAFYVDGILQNNAFNNTFTGNVSNDAIQEISVQSSFDAEFGNAASGIVNISTKEPSSEKYNINFHGITDAFLSQQPRNSTAFGGYGYNLGNVSIGGPLFPRYRDLSFYGLFEVIDQADRVPTAGFGILPGNELRQYNSVFKLNYDIGKGASFKVGGNITRSEGRGFNPVGNIFNFDEVRSGADFNVFLRRDENGNPLRYETVNYSEPGTNTIHQQYSENTVTQLYGRYTQTISAKSYLQIQGQYSRTLTELMDYTYRRDFASYEAAFQDVPQPNDDFGLLIRPGRPSRQYRKQLIDFLELRGDYELQAGEHNLKLGGQFRYHTYRDASFDPALSRTADQSWYFIGYSPEDFNYAPLTAWYNSAEATQSSIDPSTGLPVIQTYRVRDNLQNFDPRVDDARHPIIASGYIKDRYSIKDFNINIGVRFDYLNSNTSAIEDLADPTRTVQVARLPEDTVSQTEIRYTNNSSLLVIQPRVSFSFPISEQTVFHAQYGRFAQLPQLQFLYDSKQQNIRNIPSGSATSANPNLQAQITNTYEIGFQQQLGTSTAVDITTFYKENSNLVQVIRLIRSNGNPIQYYGNFDFGTIRGFDVTLRSQRFDYLNISASYTLQFAGGTNTDPNRFNEFFRRNGSAELAPTATASLDFDQRHTGNINIDYRIPLEDKSVSGFLRGWGINGLFTFNSGRPYTPANRDFDPIFQTGVSVSSGFKNTSFTPLNFQLDMKLDKRFSLFNSINATVYLWAINVIGSRNVVDVWATTGLPDDAGYTGTEAFRQRFLGILTRDFGPNFATVLSESEIASLQTKYTEQYNARQKPPDFIGIARQFRIGLMLGF